MNHEQPTILTARSGLSLDSTATAARRGCALYNYHPPPLGVAKLTIPNCCCDYGYRRAANHEVTGSHSAKYIRGFHVCPKHTAHPWACSILTMLIPLLHGAVKLFLHPFVLCYCKNRPPNGVETWSPGAEKFGISHDTLGGVWYIKRYMVF